MRISTTSATPSAIGDLPPLGTAWKQIGEVVDSRFGLGRLVVSRDRSTIGSWDSLDQAVTAAQLVTRGYEVPAVAVMAAGTRFVAKPLDVQWMDDTDPLSGPVGGRYEHNRFDWMWDGLYKPSITFAPGSDVRAIVDGPVTVVADES